MSKCLGGGNALACPQSSKGVSCSSEVGGRGGHGNPDCMSSMRWFPVGRKYQFQLHGSPSPGESREVLGVAKKSEPKVWGWGMSPELFRKLDLELRRLLEGPSCWLHFSVGGWTFRVESKSLKFRS